MCVYDDLATPRRKSSYRGRMTSIAIAVVLAVLGVLAMVFGANDDSPGLVLVGLVLVLGGVAFGGRAIYRLMQTINRP
ncbi:DUF3040 domain-containing protein [Asanoa hainanensis]|nr:DUF3040 domain-containing protein [Asanoa hainanensis]